MKRELVEEGLKKLDYIESIKLENKNELYVKTNRENIKKVVELLSKTYELNFVAEFCRQEQDKFVISVVFSKRKHSYLTIVSYETKEELTSLQDIILRTHLFEREIQDLYGLKIIGGKDTRNIVKHEFWEKDVYPLRKDFKHGKKVNIKNEIPTYQYRKVEGDDAYQIPVGPVHAGIIEPGHFRFSVSGEPIENLEIRLMYKHRGIEKLAENIDANQTNLLFERVAGECSVAYGEANALLIEKLMNISVADEIKSLRVVFLELERIYNYLGDIAGICVDIAYSYPAKKYEYFSEIIKQLAERITRSRFMRNVIVPGGINISFNLDQKQDILNTLKSINPRMNEIIETTLNSVSFLDRVENTGMVQERTARNLFLTGVVGRASNIAYDVRHSFPYENYKELKKQVYTETIGGVFERYKLKVQEIKSAFVIIEKALGNINENIEKTKVNVEIPEGKEAFVAVETVKGELLVYGKAGKHNKFDRVYFKTPSFTNWDGLSYSVLDEIVPDFPLCNKSFNMSYSENDR